MNIAIVGTGCGTCFAEMGAHVTCVDVDAQKIKYDTNLSPVILRLTGVGRGLIQKL